MFHNVFFCYRYVLNVFFNIENRASWFVYLLIVIKKGQGMVL